MKKSGTHELTPLRSNSESISSYTLNKDNNVSKNIKQLTNCDLTLFTFQQWNMYLSRTIVYPYAKVYAVYYKMSSTTFSFIMSAFDIGGCIAVLVTILPSFNRVPIHLCLFTVLLLTSFVNLGMAIFATFGGMFLLDLFTLVCISDINGSFFKKPIQHYLY